MDTNSALTALEDHIAILTMLVRRMVDESGDPTGFDAQAWLDHWLVGVVPALGDRRPLDVLNEPGGLEVLRSLLLQAQYGAFSVIHWCSDIETPRGPPLAIRPRPQQCAALLREAGFDAVSPVDLGPCAPYHFGLIAQRPVHGSASKRRRD